MQMKLTKILASKKIVIDEPLIKIALLEKLNTVEFLVLSYLANDYSNHFAIDAMCSYLNIDQMTLMEALNNLMNKNLISIETTKDDLSRYNEVINLDTLYKKMEETICTETKKEQDVTIFKTFETELGRTISPMELELINGWLSSGISESIILGALREAIYNGVNSFRYIDKIIYEWDKKGFKTIDDVKKHLKNRRESNKTVNEDSLKILEYDWLDVS